MNRFLRSAVALLAGWVAAAIGLYLPVLLVFYLPVLFVYLVLLFGGRASYLEVQPGLWLVTVTFMVGAAASPVIGCRVLERVAQRLGVAREPVGRTGWPRKLAAYGAGVGTAVLVGAATVLPLIVASRRGGDAPPSLVWAWLLGMFPAMPYFALLATRAVLRSGQRSDPNAPMAGAATAPVSPAAPEAPEPPALRIAPA